jgi:hypothetical protein
LKSTETGPTISVIGPNCGVAMESDYWVGRSIFELCWFLVMGKHESLPSIDTASERAKLHEAYLRKYLDVVDLLTRATFCKSGTSARNFDKRLLRLDRDSILGVFEAEDPKGEIWKRLHSNACHWLKSTKPRRYNTTRDACRAALRSTQRRNEELSKLASSGGRKDERLISPELEEKRVEALFSAERLKISKAIDRAAKESPEEVTRIISRCAKKVWHRINDQRSNGKNLDPQYEWLCDRKTGVLMTINEMARRIRNARFSTFG